MTIVEDHRLPKIVMFGELSTGHRKREALKKRFKDSLKKSLTTCNIDHRQWSDLVPCCWPCGLAPHNPPSCCPVWSGQGKFTQRQETEEEGLRRLHHHTRHFFSLQSLLTALSLSHRSGQPQAYLQSTSTWTNFLNLRSRSYPMMNTWLRVLYLLNRK